MTRRKRGTSNSPTPKNQANVKKVKSNSQATLPIPSSSQQQSTQQQPTQAAHSSQVPASKPVKPIFVNESLQVVRNVLLSLQFSSRPLCKVRGPKSTQVSCFDINDKKKLIEKFKLQSIGFHTFSEPSEKLRCFVLKGFYNASCDELLNVLKSSSVPAIKVSDLIRKDDFVIFLVHFADVINVNFLNHNYHVIDDIVVKWENLKRSSNKVTQCFNCQKYGHSSLSCGYPPRCVKCDISHPKGACTRTSREGDPKCCNCGGNHSANHRKCPVYIQHLEKIKSRPSKSQVTVHQSSPSLTSSQQFPALSQSSGSGQNPHIFNSVSFSQKVKDSSQVNNIFTKLSHAQNKLSSLPQINETIDIFVKMVDELSLCNDHKGRLLILTKYSIQDSLPRNGN
jgi:hypothetical protein